jgi:DNA polymerase-3 subunit beta
MWVVCDWPHIPDDQANIRETKMKLKINQQHLNKVMSAVSNAADRKSTLGIISNVLIDVGKQTTTFRCTNLNQSISARISVESDSEWSTTVDAKLLCDIAKVLPKNKDVTFENVKSKNTLKVSSGKSKFDLQTLPADDFPLNDDPGFVHISSCSASVLSHLINQTVFSMGSDSTRPHICSILFEFDGEKIKCVATDGHKLAVSTVTTEEPCSEKESIVVPARCIHEVKSIVGNSSTTFDILSTRREVVFETSEQLNEDEELFFEIRSNLVEQEFPPYEKIIPNNSDKIAELKKSNLVSAAKRIRTILSDKSSAKIVRLLLSNGELLLSTNGASLGNANESIEAVYEGEELEIGFNIDYLVDACLSSTQDIVMLKFTEPLHPALIQDDSNYLCVLMPVRLY